MSLSKDVIGTGKAFFLGNKNITDESPRLEEEDEDEQVPSAGNSLSQQPLSEHEIEDHDIKSPGERMLSFSPLKESFDNDGKLDNMFRNNLNFEAPAKKEAPKFSKTGPDNSPRNSPKPKLRSHSRRKYGEAIGNVIQERKRIVN